MNGENLKYCSFLLTILTCLSCQAGNGTLVRDVESLNGAISKAVPGDEIIMADGIWENAEIKFKGVGTEENPIILKAQTPGKVILTGQSNLGLSGAYLVVSGLTFKNGYTPTCAVIEFRTSGTDLANSCRVNNCVIDNYSNPERFDADSWVVIFGKNNQFDHNSLIDKRNLGVTRTVRLQGEENQENGHLIEYGFNVKEIGFFAWFPYVGAAIGSLSGGYFAGRLILNGVSVDRARKGTITVGSSIMFLGLLATIFLANTPEKFVAIVAGVLFGFQFIISNIQTMPSDLFSGKSVGSLAGLGGSVGVSSVIIMNFPVPVISQYSYMPIFVIIAAFVPLGAVSVHFFAKEIKPL